MTGDAPDAVPTRRKSGGVVPTLKKRADFLRLAKGHRRNTSAFSLQAGPAMHGEGRFGFTVTKKTGSAPARSRIRRRLRAAARVVTGGAPPAFDLVLIARREVLGLPFDALTATLDAEIANAGRRLSSPSSRPRA